MVFPETVTSWACENSILFLLRGKTTPWQGDVPGLGLFHFLFLLQSANPLTRIVVYQAGEGIPSPSWLTLTKGESTLRSEVPTAGAGKLDQRRGLWVQSQEEEDSQCGSTSQAHHRPLPCATWQDVRVCQEIMIAQVFSSTSSATWENWRQRAIRTRLLFPWSQGPSLIWHWIPNA